MRKIQKGKWKRGLSALLFSLFAFLISVPTRAGTYTAATCNYSDVNAVVNGPTHTAINGDTIVLPAGTSCSGWVGNTVTVPAGIGIQIIGSGTPNATPGTMGANASCTATNIVSNGAVFAFSPTIGNSTTRLSCMKFSVSTTATASPVSAVGTCNSSGCPNFRMDNLTIPSAWASGSVSDATFAIVDQVFGVADHNTVGDVAAGSSNGVVLANVSYGSWGGVGSYGDNSWASADTFGGSQQFYLENNTFNYAMGTDTDTPGSGGGGGRYACRFNTFNDVTGGSACANHGTDTNQRTRGGRQAEHYGNTINSCIGGSADTIFEFRSAVGMIWGNTLNTSCFVNSMAKLDAQRTWRLNTPYGLCDGLAPWDTNDGGTSPTVYYTGTIGSVSGLSGGTWTITDSGTPGWTTNQWAPSGAPYAFYDVTGAYGIMLGSNTPNSLSTVFLCPSCIGFRPAAGDTYKIYRATVCMDQPTRGQGALLTGSATAPVLQSTGSPGPVNEALDPMYEMDDSGVPSSKPNIGANEGMMIQNRDLYSESPNQAANTCTGSCPGGTYSPFNGTSGSGHGALANRPTTCTPFVGYLATDQGTWNSSGNGVNGEIFVCTAPNIWTLYYTPYAYPHPLTVAQGQVLPPLNSLRSAH